MFCTSACVLFSADPPRVAPIEAKTNIALPDDDEALFELANSKNRPDASIADLQTSIAAYEKLEDRILEGHSELVLVEVRWRLSRVLFYVSEVESDAQEQLRWIVKGEEIAEAVLSERPERVEGYYYAALLKGRRAQLSRIGFGAIKLAETVLALGKSAARIDESYEDGGPLRLLAMLYAKAPPWPTSIGDIDLALETAARAVEISDYPMNHLIMAEVLIEDDAFERAKEELQLVLSARKVGKWAQEGEQWRPYAMRLLDELQKK